MAYNEPRLEEVRFAHARARQALVARQRPGGFWVGELASSALATATAVSALTAAGNHADAGLVSGGRRWLISHQNADGGWGDTVDSPSNLAATLLGVAALRLVRDADDEELGSVVSRASDWLVRAKAWPAAQTVDALAAVYGRDRTFAVPILMNCALAGMVPWAVVPALPFELACVPRAWFRFVRLQVVSYALPALVAIGQAQHAMAPPAGWPRRWLRDRARAPTRRLLQTLQPDSGGFLEAVPLTSFVTMGLVAIGAPADPVAVKARQFLRETARADGSWPIDADLAVWVTSLSIQALTSRSRGGPLGDPEASRAWLRQCQRTQPHPYTAAAPGGWGWTTRPGGVPDVDDTAGALIALHRLGEPPGSPTVLAGIAWLLDIQNRDGGWPTFSRGWNRLPFDRSAPDLTAHAVRALLSWRSVAGRRGAQAVAAGLRYLIASQRPDGSWLPLWFGSQLTPEQTNPVYGTAQVLRALAEVAGPVPGRVVPESPQASRCAPWREDPSPAAPGLGPVLRRGVSYLLQVQNPDGGWGGGHGVCSSAEETGAALTALTVAGHDADARQACHRAAIHLVQRLHGDDWARPSPIGLYFARLWYSEELYPLVWIVSGLGGYLSVWE